MLYEMRTYTLKQGTAGEVVKAAAEISTDIRKNDYGKLEGYWTTEIGPLNQVQPLIDAHGVGHVVTLLAPDTPHPAPRGIAPGQHLRLYFHDIVSDMEGHTPPRSSDAEKLIGFLSGWDRQAPMLIHCWAGISRSTAAAMVWSSVETRA